jgi:hypothetical protein
VSLYGVTANCQQRPWEAHDALTFLDHSCGYGLQHARKANALKLDSIGTLGYNYLLPFLHINRGAFNVLIAEAPLPSHVPTCLYPRLASEVETMALRKKIQKLRCVILSPNQCIGLINQLGCGPCGFEAYGGAPGIAPFRKHFPELPVPSIKVQALPLNGQFFARSNEDNAYRNDCRHIDDLADDEEQFEAIKACIRSYEEVQEQDTFHMKARHYKEEKAELHKLVRTVRKQNEDFWAAVDEPDPGRQLGLRVCMVVQPGISESRFSRYEQEYEQELRNAEDPRDRADFADQVLRGSSQWSGTDLSRKSRHQYWLITDNKFQFTVWPKKDGTRRPRRTCAALVQVDQKEHVGEAESDWLK